MRTLLARMVAAVLLAAGASVLPAQQNATVSGIVRDATSSRPVLGAVVVLAGAGGERSTRTDELGSFAFSKLAPGPYTLVVRRLGYDPSRQTIDVRTGMPPVAVAIARVATLDTVRVRAAEQGIVGVVGTARELRPLPSANVQVVGLGGGKVVLDSNGHFFVPLKVPGVYIVRAQADGYEPQTVSVTVPRNEGVEIALLLDPATGPVSNMLAMAYADFDTRLRMRRNASALVPRAELLRDGGGALLGAIRNAPSFASKTLRFGETACVFVDGRPRAIALNAIDPAEIEAIELYAADPSNTLAQRWPRGMPCTDTGVPRGGYGGSDVVKWVVIWLKH